MHDTVAGAVPASADQAALHTLRACMRESTLPCNISNPVLSMIEVNERVDVAAPPDVVWALLSNPHAVVNCVNGAKLGEQHEDGTFDATMVVKFGPAKVTFNTRVALELDAAAKTGHVTARGKDNQGGTRVRATMKFSVIETADPPGSSIPISAEVEVGGKLAHLVESGATFVVKHMTRDFSERLAEHLQMRRPGNDSITDQPEE